MNTRTDPIAERLASLPLSAEARRDALAYVSTGETLAEMVIAVRDWLGREPSLRPAYRDLHAQ